MRPAPARVAAEVEALERQVWAALASGDSGADLALLDPDFLGLYPEGPADRSAHAAPLAEGPVAADWALSDLRVLSPSPSDPGLALIVYRARFTRPGDGSRHDWWISSLWRRRGPRGWTNIFSQDTPAAPDGDSGPDPGPELRGGSGPGAGGGTGTA